MMNIGILGYGNLARGVEAAIAQNEDLHLAAVYTRRDPSAVQVHTKGVPVREAARLDGGTEALDVLMLCGGSATDLPEQTPRYAALYNVVDSFDTHAHIPEHFARVDEAAKKAGKCALISCGWDPGMFSLQRLYASAILPEGADYTFWGRGVSQGHSDAIRRIRGVKDARQYTVPKEEALAAVRDGKNPSLTTRDKHTRECYVVTAEGFDSAEEKARIEKEIVTMPDYFADYDTTVRFITMEELEKNHKGLPHGGRVFRTGSTGFEKEHGHVIEYSLRLESNPEFTGSVLAAYARAVHRLHTEGRSGALTVFDIAPAYLSAMSPEDMRAHLL
ncbi:MAG: diaminopimelate dehydrogenase [Lachnospiraceae bacterium]|nr:diaminopimelate dehydrogenase [Lachnospiraceae bacterium]